MHNNANSMARRSCHNSHCKNYDHYEQRYPPEKIADLNKNAGEVEVVKGIASKDGMTGGYREVTLLYIGSGNAVVTPTGGGGHCFTLPLCLLMVPSRSTHKVFLILTRIKLLSPMGPILLTTIPVVDTCTIPLV